VSSFDKVFRALTWFDRYLATLAWPPRHPSHLAREHIDGFYDWRKSSGSASADLGELRNTLLKVEGLTEAMIGRLAAPLPKRPESQRKNSYSREELGRIAQAARGDLRAAAKRIRANRDLLARFRAGELDPGGDAELGQRLRLLDWVERFADVPRQPRKSGKTAGRMESQPWVRRFGTVAEIVGWLHLNVLETAAGAVLLPGTPLVAVLVTTQILNAVLLVPLLVVMVGIGRDEDLMGEFAIGRLATCCYGLATSVVVACVAALAFSSLL